jgi:hypothetical protein
MNLSDLADGISVALWSVAIAGVAVVGVDVAREVIFWIRMVIDPFDGNNKYHNGAKDDHWSVNYWDHD